MAHLVFFRRQKAFFRLDLDEGRESVVGRDGGCDAVVPDPDVARRQFLVRPAAALALDGGEGAGAPDASPSVDGEKPSPDAATRHGAAEGTPGPAGEGAARGWSLIDLSGRGTRVDGGCVQEASLDDGARVALGQWHAVFRSDGPSSGRNGPGEGGERAAGAGGADPLPLMSGARERTGRRLASPAARKRDAGHGRGSGSGPCMEEGCSRPLPMFWDRVVAVTEAGPEWRAPGSNESGRGEGGSGKPVRGRTPRSCKDGGRRVRQEVPFSDRLVIGRAPGCDLVLDDGQVSACHAVIFARDGERWVRDLESTNGTFLGGVRVTEARLEPGLSMRMGNSLLTWRPGPAFGAVQEAVEFEGIVGASAPMRRLFAAIDRVARCDATVLVNGESGTGKELVARAIHRRSGRSGGPFIPVNCGALSETLVESELFGHERGAFTGADRARAGAFEEASGGTLFLDEVGELPLGMQAKLLRALELFEIKRLGAARPIRVDIRVVCATNRNLKREVAQGRFREDLYWRLCALPVFLPPLRERGAEDVAALACHFLHLQDGGGEDVGFTREALSALADHPWPGNVRELRNCVARAFLLRRGRTIDVLDLRLEPPDEGDAGTGNRGGGPLDGRGGIRLAGGGDAPSAPAGEDEPPEDEVGDRVFAATCESLNFCVSAVARTLGKSRGTIYRRMARLGIGGERGRPSPSRDQGRGERREKDPEGGESGPEAGSTPLARR